MKWHIGAGIGMGVMIGVALGTGAYTFIYARGYSYLSDDPEACVNCHIMREQFDAWHHSSHRAVATCNDCHTPTGFAAKWWTKAQNGFWHSYYFTLGTFPDPIRITERNRRVTEEACRKCHADIVHAIEMPAGRMFAHTERLSCTPCHRDAGHMH
jgi:cytochrome c nitrite reductase small subunit